MAANDEYEDDDSVQDSEFGGEDADELETLLADLDEEARARINQRIEEEARARAETAIQQMKGSFGRWGHAQQVLAEQLGLVVDEHGNVAAADPVKLATYAQQFSPGSGGTGNGHVTGERGMLSGTEPTSAGAEDEIVLDPFDDAATLTRKARLLAERQARALLEEATRPLRDEIGTLRGLLSRTYVQQAPEVARQALREWGVEGLAETSEFQAIYAQLVEQMPPQDQANQKALKMAAVMAAVETDERLRQAGRDWRGARDAALNPRATAGAAARAGLVSTGASRGAAAPATSSPQVSEEDRIVMELMNITDSEEYLAVRDPTGEALRRLQDKRERESARRR